MKLKTATLLAIIGVIFQLIPQIMYFMTNFYTILYMDPYTGKVNWYFHCADILLIIGIGLLLPFFITLSKSLEES